MANAIPMRIPKRDRESLRRFGEAIRRRGILLCGYAKLKPHEQAAYMRFFLSLDWTDDPKEATCKTVAKQ